MPTDKLIEKKGLLAEVDVLMVELSKEILRDENRLAVVMRLADAEKRLAELRNS